MRLLALFSLLFLFSIASAEEIELTVYEERDFGPAYEEDFDELEITMECGKSIIYIDIEDEDVPITGAIVRIMYIDYSTPLLASGPTDVEGEFDYTLVGEKNFMRGLFLVIVEKEGYRQKEAHFDISNCFDYEEEPDEGQDGPLIYDTTPPTIPESEFPEPGTEHEPEIPPEPGEPGDTIPEPGPETEENITDLPEPDLDGNLTENITGNATGNETGDNGAMEPEYICVSSFILLLAAALLVLYH